MIVGGVIIIVSVEVWHDITIRIKSVLSTILPLMFVIVPKTVTVYLPLKIGLYHITCLVNGLNVINYVLDPLSAINVAEYTMFDYWQ